MQSDDSATNKLALVLSVAALIFGICFYLVWGLAYNTWDITVVEHIGVYAVTVVACGFGVTGILLFWKK